jgi:Predicted transcriptional regulator
MSENQSEFAALTAQIVASYLGGQPLPAEDIPKLIHSIHAALAGLGQPITLQSKENLSPAVPIRRSVTRDQIVCLECGQTFKMLRRHLRTDHEMAPDEYRERWNLPTDYPMVAPNYATVRSEMAKAIGLGVRGRAARRKA